MALVLPLLALLLLFPIVRQHQTAGSREAGGWEGTLLLTTAFWGAGLALLSEGLSLFHLLRPTPIFLAWLAVDSVLAVVVLRRHPRTFRGAAAWIRSLSLPVVEVVFLAGIAAVLMVLLVVGWIAPPNNADSLLYHMARVMHWAQNGGLQPYATGLGQQLWNPPWAELAILHLRTLWGNDTPAELVQWFSLIGLLVAVSGIGRLLGLGRSGRLVAVGFAIGLPMVVLQATSTQNDLVTAFWVVTAACLVLFYLKTTPSWVETSGFGAAVGLALLTKGTAYIFVAPLVAWYLLASPWRRDRGVVVRHVVIVGLVILVLNLGYWTRNLAAAGTPLGPSDWVTGNAFGSLKSKIALYPIRIVRGLAQHLATPWPAVNDAIDSGIKSLYALFGVDVNARLVVWAWNHEDRAGHPLHLLLVLATLPWLVRQRRWRSAGLGRLGLAALAGLGLLFLLVSPSLTVEGIRLQLPFFTLWAPVFAAWIDAVWPRRWMTFLAALLLVAGLPWLLFNSSRPVIGLRPDPGPWEWPCTDAFGCTTVGSVFAEPPDDLLFANVPGVRADVPLVSAALRATACTAVGLRLDSHDPEYLLWHFLGAPESGFHLETIYTTPDLAALVNREFRPCAIVCTLCGGRTRLHGLDLHAESGGYKLFVGSGFTRDEDG